MKKRHIDYEEERETDLLNVYRCYLGACDFVRLDDVWQELSGWPARRFYVSERRAREVVKRLLRGDGLNEMSALRREMFLEVFHRVSALHARHPQRRLRSLCAEVVMQPAPRFYLSPSSIKAIVNAAKKREALPRPLPNREGSEQF